MPIPLSYKIAELLSLIIYFFDKKRRTNLEMHLINLLPFCISKNNLNFLTDKKANENNEKIIKRLAKNTYRNFAKYLVDFFRLPKLNLEYIKKTVSIYGLENIKKIKIEYPEKGIIFFTAHFGNWELGAAITSKLVSPLTVIALDHPDPRITEFFNVQRTRLGMKVLPMNTASIRECYKTLQKGGLVGILGDVEFSDNKEAGITLNFLGERIRVPKGPAALSRKTGAFVMPSVMVRHKNNKFSLHFEPAIAPIISENEEGDLIKNTYLYLSALKKYFVSYPDQWYRFWK